MGSQRRWVWLLGVILVFGIAGCGGNDGGTNPTPPQEPGLSITTVTVPQSLQNSVDPKAQAVVQYLGVASGFAAYSGFLTPPAGKDVYTASAAASGPPWEHTWTDGGLTITMTVSDAGTAYHWDIVLDGTDGTYNYSQWAFIHVEQTKDRKTGEMAVYDFNTTDVAVEWDWSTNAQNVYAFQMVVPEDNQIAVTSNPDGSGDVEVSEYAAKTWNPTFRATWASDGSGEWWEYEEGVLSDSGEWSESTEPGVPPELEVAMVELPDHMLESQDPMAQMAVGYVLLADALSNFVNAYATPHGEPTGDGPPWTYSWSYSGLTMILTIDQTAEVYEWDTILDGTDGYYTYSNWRMLHAERSLDGMSGQALVYQPVTTDVETEWSWATDPLGVYGFTMTTYGSGAGRVEIEVLPDQSGSVEFYDETAPGVYDRTSRVEWAADGTGNWWTYSGGTETASGSWT